MTNITFAIIGAFAAAAPIPPRAGTVWERPLIAPSTGSVPGPETKEPDGRGEAPIGVAVLDSLIYRHSRPDFADLRVYGPGPRPLGSKLAPAIRNDIHCADESVTLQRMHVEFSGDSVFEAVFLAEDSAGIPDRISVLMDARDFEISLSLWTARSIDDRGNPEGKWKPRLQEVPLFDFSRFLDWRQESADWRPDADRAVRIRIGGLTRNRRAMLSTLSGKIGKPESETLQMEREPLHVKAIGFERKACRAIADSPIWDTVDLANRPIPRFADPEGRRTWYVFDGGRYPLAGLLLGIAPGNFLRSAMVTGLEDTASVPMDKPWLWRSLGEAVIHRIDWGRRADSCLRIPLASSGRYAVLALGVLDNDDPPLDLRRARAEVPRMLLYFPVAERDSLALRYGDSAARPLQSEFGSMLERGGDVAAAGFILGPPRLLPAGATRPATGFASGGRIGDLLLKAGLALAVVALMFLLSWTARRVGKEGG